MKKHRVHIIILGLILLVTAGLLLANMYAEKVYLSKPATFGLSYSPKYASELGLDPKKTYQDILYNLKVKDLRLNANWDEIEAQKDQFKFEDLDYYISEASKSGTNIILAIGYKLPRWPECRAPGWVDSNSLRERQLVMLKATIEHYDQNPTIKAFQIENEPLLDFGICPPVDKAFFEKEVAFVKSQTKKEIVLTDAGEPRPWVEAMQLSDVFGTTLYRKINVNVLGDIYYPLPPWHYKMKSDFIRKFFAPTNQETFVAELQTETWAQQPLNKFPVEEQINHYDLDEFKRTILYARRTGFSKFYLWGVEWWYYLATQNHPEYIEYAKTLF
jgi:hypothetical protein